MNKVVGTHDLVLLVIDSLRFDIADGLLRGGRTPVLAGLLPEPGWERRHTPATFGFAALLSFLSGFLPTPAEPPGRHHARIFAARFPGSETTHASTWVFDAPTLPQALADRGYHTACIGGVPFLDGITPLGQVIPSLFTESYWSPQMGVMHLSSAEHQFLLAAELLARLPAEQRLFLLLNVAATYPPTRGYRKGAKHEGPRTHAAALQYVDEQLPTLLNALARRDVPTFCILCSDHGTAYGEDGYFGHRIAHPTVWTVPYAEVVLNV